MSRLDVYKLPGGPAKGYVVDVQSRLIDQFKTRVVVPLLPIKTAPKPVKGLNPTFDIVGELHVLVTEAIAAIPARELKHATMSLDAHHDDITRALDTLLIGF